MRDDVDYFCHYMSVSSCPISIYVLLKERCLSFFSNYHALLVDGNFCMIYRPFQVFTGVILILRTLFGVVMVSIVEHLRNAICKIATFQEHVLILLLSVSNNFVYHCIMEHSKGRKNTT